MREMLWRVVVMAVTVALAVPAAAQEPAVAKGTVETSAGGGASFPLSDFTDSANTGFNAGGRAAYYVTDRFGVGGQFVYERFGASDELLEALSDLAGASVEANFDLLHFAGYGKYRLFASGRAVPYVKGQLGIATIKASGRAGTDGVNCAPPGCLSEEKWVTDFAAGGGVGVDIRFGEIFGGYAEAHYNAAFTEGSSTQSVWLHAGVILYTN